MLAAPDPDTWIGRRDHALLAMAIQTGLRVSELAQLNRNDLQVGTGAHVQCLGKGRKHRATPLTTQTVAIITVWLNEHRGKPDDPLFPTSTGHRLSRDAIRKLVVKHAVAAQRRCPSLIDKRPTPHVLRHTAAMTLLQAGVDVTVIAL